MKILILSLLLFTCNNAICQDTENSIEHTNIHIINAAKKSYSLGSANELQKAFGKATIKKEQDEVLGGYAYTYMYKGLETYFNEKNWEATIITSSDYVVVLDGTPYKIGEQISKFKDHFPISYKHKERRSQNDNGLWISISHKKQYTDAFIFIKYNDDGYITEITITNDNS